MDAYETIEKDGWKVEVFLDDDAQSPDTWDNLATFQHSTNYTFGEDLRREPERGWPVYIRALTLLDEDVAGALPVYIAEHGPQLSMWPTEAEHANGVLFTTHKRLNELCGEDAKYHTREWVEEALTGEAAVWRQYLEGDVWGYQVTMPDGSFADSCWGFYGVEYAIEEAKEALDACIDHEAREITKVDRITAL